MGFPEIPGYVIEEEIGRGGMGVVYRARHLALDRTVALKVLHAAFCDDEEFVKSFAQEAKVIARLAHPHIVSVYDFGTHEGVYYLSMQYVQGRTVADVMKTRKLSLDEVAKIVLQVAEALDFAHRSEVIHRDIKPGNIMLCNDGKAMVMDFGVASATYASGASSVWVTAGSPAYMSPEQCRGLGASPRSDQYSLGVTVYEMVTGRLPFPDRDPVATMRQQISDTPPPLRLGRTDISPRTEAAVQRALSKMPEMRFATIGAFAEEFDAACREEPALQTLVGSVPGGLAAGRASAGPGRAPVSLIDGPAAPAAARSDYMNGYVYTTRGGGDGRRKRSFWTWLLVLLVFGGIASAACFTYLRSQNPPPPAPKPKSRTGKNARHYGSTEGGSARGKRHSVGSRAGEEISNRDGGSAQQKLSSAKPADDDGQKPDATSPADSIPSGDSDDAPKTPADTQDKSGETG